MLQATLTQLLTNFWYFIPILLLLSILKSNWFKVKMGEWIVNIELQKLDKLEEYTLLNNITLKTENGTTQIDHILLSPYGFFVIETKNYQGWIYGSAKQKTWTQTIYKHKSSFQNPLHQNYKHSKTIESYLNIDHKNIFSVVAFTNKATFKTEMPDNVLKIGKLVSYIKEKNETIFSTKEVESFIEALESGREKKSIITDIKHTQSVKKNISTPFNDRKIEIQKDNVCPKCGSEMVLRVVKKGEKAGNEFLGCSGFPKCRFTRRT